MKNNPIGIMQGRLLPKYKGRYQAHPVGNWQDEFIIARELGLDCIEFILDFNDYEQNPLMSEQGIEELQKVIDKTNVQVYTICADYFMEAPLHGEDLALVTQSIQTLGKLIDFGSLLHVTDIVMPCVDQSSLRSEQAKERFIKHLTPLLDRASKHKVNISLETDLPPEPFAILIDRFNSENITVNYDTGNSASLGFDPEEELRYYGARISDIHIKDRMLGGGSVTLGTGNTQFDKFFRSLKQFDYKGPFIFQAYRDDEGIEIFRSQMNWVSERNFLKEYNKKWIK